MKILMMIDVEMLIIFGSSTRERPLGNFTSFLFKLLLCFVTLLLIACDSHFRHGLTWQRLVFSSYGTKDFENMVEAAELSVSFMILLW